MRVLLLSSDNPECEELKQYLISCSDEVVLVTERVAPEKVREINPDIIVSYNSRYILKEDDFSAPRLGTINLHISYLPWNRGADPNLWSHLEGTPKGVTIHYIDAGIDTGDIIVQEAVKFSKDDTLRSSYEKLHVAIRELFKKKWPKIKSGKAPRYKQQGEGTFHLLKDKEPFRGLLAEMGYDILIKDLATLHLNDKIIHLRPAPRYKQQGEGTPHLKEKGFDSLIKKFIAFWKNYQAIHRADVRSPRKIIEANLGKAAADLFEKLSLQKPDHADAIVLLQGDRLDRSPEVASLYRMGFAETVLISGNNILVGPNTRPDENDLPLSSLKEYLIFNGVPAEAILIDDRSMNSRDQAENIIKIAKLKKWPKILVVVSGYHLLRAYLALVKQIVLQNWKGKLIMRSAELFWDQPPSGRTRTALQMLEVETGKIKKYAKDLASINLGLRFFQKPASKLKFFIRSAALEDSGFLFNLRNEESVRRRSFNTNLISFAVHSEWFKKMLVDEDSQIFIAEVSGQPMAQVRFDLINEVEAEVNIAVTEKFQGRGYGSEILRQSAVKFFETFPKVNLIHALIKLDNLASIRSFGKAGFRWVRETVHKDCKCVEMVLTRY